MRLLLIEDEMKIVLPLKKGLERHKYAVDFSLDGNDGLEKARFNNYDCLILDLNLPGLDGLTIARRLREQNITTPILILTSRTEQDDVIEGFESGADDYLMKPFHFEELLLRINALIRRNSINKMELLKFGTLEVNTFLKKIFNDGQEVILNAKEYGILEYLLRNMDRVISQEELLEHVWDREIDCFTQTVRTNVKTLRQKIDPLKKIIKTIKGSGYAIKKI